MELQKWIKKQESLPNVWGEGLIFAYSGLAGETNVSSGFVLTAHNRPFSFLIHTPRRHVLELRCENPGEVLAATSDVLVVNFDDGLLIVTFSAWHSVIGILPDSVDLRLVDKTKGCSRKISGVAPVEGVLVLEFRRNRFCLGYGNRESEAKQRAFTGLDADVEAIALEHLQALSLPFSTINVAVERLAKKCLSVMRVNTLSAEGEFKQKWSTPDRVPHKDCWLWDSVFHSFGMNGMDPAASWDFLACVLDQQHTDGMISHQAGVTGKRSSITQPPILAWGVWENYQWFQQIACLEAAAPKLEQYLEWDLTNRDKNQNGLLEWFIEEHENCRSGESGLDNSPRFDEALLLDAVDFSVFAALDMLCLSKIFNVIGEKEKGRIWEEKSRNIEDQIHQWLWDDVRGFYFDRKMDGSYSSTWAVTGFLPLLLPNIPAERVNRLGELLADEQHFNVAFPIPSVSLSDPSWSTDMWRGASWINLNYLVGLGLKQHGRSDLAKQLMLKTIEMVSKYYQKYGVIFEFYDSKDEIPPTECDRKGPPIPPYDLRLKMDSIRDYHWSAALSFLMIREVANT